MSNRTDDLMHAICPECRTYDGHPVLGESVTKQLAGCSECGAVFSLDEAVVC